MEDRAVIVTGGGSGIGRAVALLCAERGARVAVLDLRNDEAEHTAEEALRRGARRAISVQCDVGIESEVESALVRCRHELGGPSGIFANAGVELNGPAHEMTYETWNRVITTNLTGIFLTCKYALRAMVENGEGGAIVCTSSPAAFVGFAGGGNGPYAASKGGVSALVRALALDYAPYGVRINAVVPGATDTPMMWAGFPAAEREAARRGVEEKAKNEIPLGRLARPEEPARAVLWLLSDESSYVTGSHLVCDGGILAKGPNTF
jgi:NAD(P)-dependent dehydrogenase (short-subunit alcohol dehydrogenase family)